MTYIFNMLQILFSLTLSHVTWTYGYEHGFNTIETARKFPIGFQFGAATASYQVEGAWNEDGKSENIWDHFTHRKPSPIKDDSTGDIADDSYHLYKRDVQMMRELGLDFYRFSISWSRIMPSGFPNEINQNGINYYNNLINEMLKYNIKPMVTLYHWDLPLNLQNLGGWANSEIVNWFSDYARVAFQNFGDRVKLWITINEPPFICNYGYGGWSVAPAYNMSGIADYLCSKNILLAHARAYHIYDKGFRPYQNGIIGIAVNAGWEEPATKADIDAANEAASFYWGQYVHPIFANNGGYPHDMERKVAAKSRDQGFPRSRLPHFTPEESDLIKGTADFLGLNHYRTVMTYRNESVLGSFPSPSFLDDLEVSMFQKREWHVNGSKTVQIAPWGFHRLLKYIKQRYNNPPIYITENGCPTRTGLIDNDRVLFLREYLNSMLDAIDEGSDIRGYTVWSLMDVFEWSRGYTVRYGLYEVNYHSPLRTRTPRKSAFVYKEILRSRILDYNYEPNITSIMIDNELSTS